MATGVSTLWIVVTVGGGMGAAPVLLNVAIGWAETTARALEAPEELSADDLASAIAACRLLRDMLTLARRSLEERLAHGVDATAFAASYDRASADLRAVLTTTQGIVQRALTRLPSPPGDEFVSSYRGLVEDMLSLQTFLGDALEKAQLPPHPVDWKHVHAVEAAYAQGETKPFQRSPHGS